MDSTPAAQAIALYQQGVAALQAQQWERAQQALLQAIDLQPQFPQAHASLGYLRDQQDDAAGAEHHWRTALALAPGLAAVHMNLGTLLTRQKRLAEAQAAFAAALALDPASSAVWSNLGSLYLGLHQEDDAEACLRQAMTLAPDNHKARFNLAYLQLRRGQFDEGWELFESRDWYAAMYQYFAFPRWRGEPLHGKSLVLTYEAGHGDVIHFCRYARLLKDRGVRQLTLICHPALERLLRSLDALDSVISFASDVPRTGHDYWMPLLSAPYHFHGAHVSAAERHAESVYAQLPYLYPDPALVDHWAGQITPGRLRIGLAWQGNPRFENDSDRSLVDASLLRPLWDIEGAVYHSLQKGPGQEQAQALARQLPLNCVGESMQDFADAAAIVSQLDLVISVDTAMAHLTAALGKPCWLLLPDYMTDWRWGCNGASSAWYPGVMRLFRQDASADWARVIQAVTQALRDNPPTP